MYNHLKFLVTSLVILLLQLQYLSATPNDKKEFKIGVIQYLSGEFAPQGQAMLDGSKLAVDEINEDLSLDFKLNLIPYDFQALSQKAFVQAKKLVEIDKADAVLVADYHPAKAIAPYLEKKKIPLIVLWDSNPELDNMGEYIFGIGPWTPGGGEVSAKATMQKFSAKCASLIAFQEDWSLATKEYFKKQFVADGGEIVSDDVFQIDETDFRTTLTRIKAKKPNVIYSVPSNNNVTFIKQYRELGLNIPLFTSDVLSNEMIAEAKAEFEGVFQTQSVDPSSDVTMKMLDNFKIRYNKDVNLVSFTTWGYDAVKLIAETIKSGAKNSQEIAKGMYAIKNYEGTSGNITINEKGSAPKLVELFRVKDGKLVKE